MKQVTKKQHFIPEFYLKNFCAEDGKLAVYDCRYNKYHRKTPAQICYEKYLYETKVDSDSESEEFVLVNEIENYFRDKETIYSECIDRILKTCDSSVGNRRCICTKVDMEVLDDFVSNMLLRNPLLYNKIDDSDLYQEILNSELFQDWSGFLSETSGYSPDAIIRMFFNMDSTDSDINYSCAYYLRKQISKMNFSFYVSTGARFVFGEFPFAIHLDDSKRIDKLLIPLSPKCLLMYHRYPFCGNKYIVADDNEIYIDNRLLISISTSNKKLLFAQNKEDIESVLRFEGEINV